MENKLFSGVTAVGEIIKNKLMKYINLYFITRGKSLTFRFELNANFAAKPRPEIEHGQTITLDPSV